MGYDKDPAGFVQQLETLVTNREQLAALLDALDIEQLRRLSDASLTLRNAVEDRLF
jgi:hypothetical protein